MTGEPEQLAEGTLISHLLELRDRLLRGVIAIAIALVPCMYFSDEIFTFVAQPLIDKLPKGATLIATSVVSPFLAPFKLAVFAAVFIAMPYVLYQIWAFVAPGLYRREKRFAVPLVFSSIVLFYVGVAFAYLAVFPVMFEFFAHTTPKGVTMMTDISAYLSFVLTIFLCFGLAFEVPIAVVLLTMTGLVRLERLTANRGYVLIAVFIIAAILTPPDPISQTIMAVPMYMLFEGGILLSRLVGRMRPADGATDSEQAEA
ncbi:MAG: twin-arginine translocase subunit TatC [Steroidobacteraceae bacterium]